MYPSKTLMLTGLLALTAEASPMRKQAPTVTVPAAPGPSGVNGNANPFTYPLSNGFPSANMSNGAISEVEGTARGTLPNGPPPPSLAADDITSLELIAFNEIFEVAFFTELLYNITNKVSGYEVDNQDDYDQLVATITVVQAQEQLHALNAQGALKHFGVNPIQPCQYNIPVDNLKDALNLAKTFTDVVLGTLANVQTHLAQNSDIGLIAAVGSVIGQEGEQNGYYRSALNMVPSALPFLTASSRAFAFSALNQNFVVPGSCAASVAQINLPIFANLALQGTATAQDQTLTFIVSGNGAPSSLDGLSLVYINQQNTPVVIAITPAASQAEGCLTFTANFPYAENLMNGLTIAALVSGSGPFDSADSVAAKTLAGPALIEIN